ncbi:MAG TPA: hypothetical protein VE777_00910 [Gaiellales bacterium]|jgi:hypothetical protein|nr:hypothetical protein [Gaiellales bacterium]
MPYPRFHPRLNISNDGTRLRAAGPLPIPDYQTEEVRVFGVVTQEPAGCMPKRRDDCKGDDEDRVPPAATCHGEATRKGADLQAAENGEPGTWFFEADVVGGASFRRGWARGTAIALVFQRDGDIVTYSWSAWVWLEPEVEANP